MRVCFIRPGHEAVPHAEALARAGAEVVVAEVAPEGRFDVAVACGWRACEQALRVDAERFASLVLRLEHRALAPERPERLAAVVALDLPLDLLVTSRWLDEAVAEQHPAARRRFVPLGRPPVASALPADGGPLRVAGAPGEVLAAVSAPVVPVAASAEADVVVALDGPLAEDLAAPVVAPSPLGELLDAFSAGATCVTVPTEGRTELVVHRETGLLADPDDLPGVARELDALARDRELLARLQAGALAAASAAPSWDDAGRTLLATLSELDAPAGDPRLAAQLMANALGEATKLSAYESARSHELHTWAAQVGERARVARAGAAHRLRARLRGGS